jgi:hypothetical protein
MDGKDEIRSNKEGSGDGVTCSNISGRTVGVGKSSVGGEGGGKSGNGLIEGTVLSSPGGTLDDGSVGAAVRVEVAVGTGYDPPPVAVRTVIVAVAVGIGYEPPAVCILAVIVAVAVGIGYEPPAVCILAVIVAVAVGIGNVPAPPLELCPCAPESANKNMPNEIISINILLKNFLDGSYWL